MSDTKPIKWLKDRQGNKFFPVVHEDSVRDVDGNTLPEKYAPLDSPTFIGTPTAPTAPNNTNNTQIATTAFVQNVVSTSTGIPILDLT